MKLSYSQLLLGCIALLALTGFLFVLTHHQGRDGSTSNGNSHISSKVKDLKSYLAKLEQAVKEREQDKGLKGKIQYERDLFHSNSNIGNHEKEMTPETKQEPESNRQEMHSVEHQLTDKVAKILNKEENESWLDGLSKKLLCLRLSVGGIYLYHARKAAGTSVREILTQIASDWNVPYYETEGIVLKRELIQKSGILTVTSLREPISRIMSLYWYEHVGWYDGVLKQTERCKTLKEWTNAWIDGSKWKTEFVRKNPDSVYVEVDNYYVKMLSGWKYQAGLRNRHVTEEDLEKAKEVLRSFDIVLLSDWLSDNTQIEAINALFPGRNNIAASHKVQGDKNAKNRLKEKLAPDEDAIKEMLRSINKYDLELWDYAQTLMAYRLKVFPTTVTHMKEKLGMDEHLNKVVNPATIAAHQPQCKKELDYTYSNQLKASIGIFQPPGHKGPF